MKIISALLILTAPAAFAQTAAPASKPVVHHTATNAVAGAPACSKLPVLSPKIPALPAGLPCAKPLYTITTVPSVKLDYVSPLESPDFKDTLGIETNTFSLSYIDVKPGAGELAAGHKFYTIHYTGYLVDGTKFDSSVDRGEPITIAYGQHQVITGWDTGFAGMHVGAKRRLFIPFQLAYGPNGKGPIPPKAMLVFDVELVKVSDTPPEPKAPPASAQPKPATPPPAGAPATPPAAAPATPPPAATKPATPPPATPPATTPKP